LFLIKNYFFTAAPSKGGGFLFGPKNGALCDAPIIKKRFLQLGLSTKRLFHYLLHFDLKTAI